jgi:hypothetical protein
VRLVLVEPGGDRGRGNAAICFLLEARRSLLECIAEVVVADGGEDHAQGIGLVVERGRAWSEGPLAGGAAPELHDLQFLSAGAAAREVAAAAVRTGFGVFGCERDAGDAWDARRHKGWAGMCPRYHAEASRAGLGTVTKRWGRVVMFE